MIPYGKQSISDDDVRAVVDTLRSDFLTQGPRVPEFERAIADHCRVPHAVAVNSATSALHVACLALGIGPGDRVWTVPNTFVATANCARYCGATIDFVDIDPVTYNMSLTALETRLFEAQKHGCLPKAVIPVHFSGLPCNMKEVHALAQRYAFYVIEDASHAVGARYGETIIGDCHYSDITVFSFHPVKIITTGEGGVATTRSSDLAQRMRLFRSHGITRDPAQLEQADEGPWYYEQQCLGFNYRLTELQAALGITQLARLEEWINRRHILADVYDAELRALPLILPQRSKASRSALHLYVILVDSGRTRISRRTVFDQLRSRDIGVNVHYIPVHTQPDFRALGFKRGQFPDSEFYYSRCISLPMYSSLTDADQQRVVGALREILA